MATYPGGKARPRSHAGKSREAEEIQRALEIHRARIEERRQRLEEEKHRLAIKSDAREERKLEIEKDKIVVEVHKHISTVVAAIILVLSYFGKDIIPFMTRLEWNFGFSYWEFSVFCLVASYGLSLATLILPVMFPEKVDVRGWVKVMTFFTVWALLSALSSAISALITLDPSP